MRQERDFDGDKGGETRASSAVAAWGSRVSDQERRQGQRHMSILRVGKMVTPRGEDFCLIRNISEGGLMAKLYRAVNVGERVTIELRAERRLAGEVRWARDDAAGIQFDAPIDVAAVLADREEFVDGRHPRPPRLSHSCRATLRLGAEYHRVTVVDISQGGVKVAVEKPVAEGVDAMLTMEGFRPVAGLIRWCRDGHAGIGFNQVIPYPELTAWLRDQPR